jgi:hypothetical protein
MPEIDKKLFERNRRLPSQGLPGNDPRVRVPVGHSVRRQPDGSNRFFEDSNGRPVQIRTFVPLWRKQGAPSDPDASKLPEVRE